MNKLLQQIHIQKASKKKMLAILLDPDKCVGKLLNDVLTCLNKATPDFIFIGGSSRQCTSDELLDALRPITTPKILFPGDASQFSPQADGLLFLSLISGRNPDYLIGQHVASALKIKESNIEVIPTGYILIDGGTSSSVSRISQTSPLDANDEGLCTATAIAGQLLGMQTIYLEAGSGALQPVKPQLISTIAQTLSIPLIVGGGIKHTHQLTAAFDAGADVVVVGNVFETEPQKITTFIHQTAMYNSGNTTIC